MEFKDYKIDIYAQTYFGIRHGLETLSQLISYDEITDSLQMHSYAFIKDAPKHSHRGILIDTARNFIPTVIIRQIIDAMSYNKLNILHWHITDTHSFPLELESIPELAKYGAYSSSKVYSPSDIKSLVQYAKVRGVKILPEFDAPAHVGNGWQFTQNSLDWGKIILCMEKENWMKHCAEPPCGQVNVILQCSDLSREFLESISN